MLHLIFERPPLIFFTTTPLTGSVKTVRKETKDCCKLIAILPRVLDVSDVELCRIKVHVKSLITRQ